MDSLKTGLRAVLITANRDLKLDQAIFSSQFADFMQEVDKYAPGESGLNHSYGIAYFDIRSMDELDDYLNIMEELNYVNIKFCPIGVYVNISTYFKYNMIDCTLDTCNEKDLMNFTTNLFASAAELADKVWEANEDLQIEFKENPDRFWQWLWCCKRSKRRARIVKDEAEQHWDGHSNDVRRIFGFTEPVSDKLLTRQARLSFGEKGFSPGASLKARLYQTSDYKGEPDLTITFDMLVPEQQAILFFKNLAFKINAAIGVYLHDDFRQIDLQQEIMEIIENCYSIKRSRATIIIPEKLLLTFIKVIVATNAQNGWPSYDVAEEIFGEFITIFAYLIKTVGDFSTIFSLKSKQSAYELREAEQFLLALTRGFSTKLKIQLWEKAYTSMLDLLKTRVSFSTTLIRLLCLVKKSDCNWHFDSVPESLPKYLFSMFENSTAFNEMFNFEDLHFWGISKLVYLLDEHHFPASSLLADLQCLINFATLKIRAVQEVLTLDVDVNIPGLADLISPLASYYEFKAAQNS